MGLSEMNPSEQLDQLSAMLVDAIETDKRIAPEKLEMIKVHAFVNIAYQLSIITSERLLQSKK